MKLNLIAVTTALMLAAGGAFAAQPSYAGGSTVLSSNAPNSQLTSPDANPNYHGPGSTWDYHGAVG